MMKKMGNWSFLAGVVIAILLGVAGPNLGGAQVWLNSLLVVLGIVVGYLNVSKKEAKDFALMATLLVVAAYAGNASGILASVQLIGAWLAGVMGALLVFLVPATVVAVVKGIWDMGSS
jgi:hypothetical protein